MPITPLYSNSTNSRHSKPYLRSTSQQQAGLSSTISNRRTTRQQQQPLPIDLQQVELGIVSGSPLNRSKFNEAAVQQQPAKSSSSSGLLTKCVDWLFRSPAGKKTNKSKQQLQQQQQELATKGLDQEPEQQQQQQQQPPTTKTVHYPSGTTTGSLFSNHHHNNNNSNFNSLPYHHHHNNNSNNNRSTQRINNSNSNNHDWLRSQSPFASSNHNPPLPTSNSSSSLYPANSISFPSASITVSKSERRRPSTSHATLQIPFSSNQSNSLSNRVFGHQGKRPAHNDFRVRSLSPLRQQHSGRSTISPSAQIAQSSSFSSLGRISSPKRTLNSTFGIEPSQNNYLHPHASSSSVTREPATDSNSTTLLSQKREHEQMSISPIRENGSETQPEFNAVFANHSQASKRQMLYDQQLGGFFTKEAREKLKREADLKLREKEGRPIPTNEAEKILEILETGRNPNSFLGAKRHTANLPNIPVPIPSTSSSQRTNRNRPNAFGTSLTEIYEEQASHSNPGTIIAPFTKKLEAERLKRAEEKKGQLRAEIKKRKIFEENLHKRNQSALQDDGEGPDSTTHTDHATDLIDQRSAERERSQRSESVESNTEPPRRRAKSSRKIGKLTSSSSRAKVNQGRKSRSVSVNEEDSNDILENSTTVPSGRQNTKSGRLESKKTSSRSFKNLKSPSPIQEEPENDDSDDGSGHKNQPEPEIDQNSSCLHPTVRSTSASLQVPLSSMTKSTSTSSLRPGRTFSSRRHIKAKVFSAREEDLPQLNDLDEEEVADEESEKLKKIKLPSTFLSSFKLEKFNPNPPQVDAQPDQQTLSNKASTSTPDVPQKSLFGGQFAAPTTTAASASANPFASSSGTAPSIFTQTTTSSSFSSAPKDDNVVQPNKPTSPSTFFGLSNKDESAPAPTVVSASDVNAEGKVESSQSFAGGFSRISSDVPPPNFFATLTPSSQPNSDSSSLFKKVDPVQKSGLFNFQATNNPVTNSTGAPDLFKPSSDLDSAAKISPFGTFNQNNDTSKPSEPQPSPFGFGSQQSTAPTCTSESVEGTNNVAQTQSTKTAVPTFSFTSASSQATSSIFGSQPTEPINASGSSQMTNNPTQVITNNSSIGSFSFGATQPTTTTARPNGMFDMMDSTHQPTSSSSTTVPSIFGPTPATVPPTTSPSSATSTTGFSFGNLNNNPNSTKPNPLNFANTSSTTPTITSPGATTNPFNFGGSTTSNAPSGSNLFGGAPPVVNSNTSSSPFTFGATPTAGAGGNNTNFVFGASNPSSSTVTPSPFGQPSSSSVGPTPNNNSTSNVFNFGGANQTPSSSSTVNGGTTFAGLSSSNNLSVGNGNNNNPSPGMFGMMNPVTNNNTPSFTFGANNNTSSTTSTSGFGKPTTNSTDTSNSNVGLFGGFGKQSTTTTTTSSTTPSLFGNSNQSNGIDNNQNKSLNIFGGNNNTTSTGFGGSGTSMGMDTHQSSSIFGGGSSTPVGGGMFGSTTNGVNSSTTNGPPTSQFSFGGAGTNNPPSNLNFGQPSNNPLVTPSTPSHNHHSLLHNNSSVPGTPQSQTPAPNNPTPGGFSFNIGSSTTVNDGPGSASTVRVTRKLPATRKTRR
ncbi:hypothetical protein MJO29_015313 [Puccinia striiformis f. sp. tritici]|nr:hypothetical protein Pst134EB_029601 [Puccinia striiformis f. sp. tritici]KAI7936010.1 hypothetical protein MJO29_015313 [Puccinia striiformis f. sp. tritici]